MKNDRRKKRNVNVKCVSGVLTTARTCDWIRGRGTGFERNSECDARYIFIGLRTTTYESNNQPCMSSTLKILSIVTRALAQVLHVHVTMGAAIVAP